MIWDKIHKIFLLVLGVCLWGLSILAHSSQELSPLRVDTDSLGSAFAVAVAYGLNSQRSIR